MDRASKKQGSLLKNGNRKNNDSQNQQKTAETPWVHIEGGWLAKHNRQSQYLGEGRYERQHAT